MTSPIYQSKEFIKIQLKCGVDVYALQEQSWLSQWFNWIIDSKTGKSRELTKWLEDQVFIPALNVSLVADDIKKGKSDDETVMNVLKYVKKNLKYIPDILGAFQRLEYWQNAQETINEWKGDCEDGAVLIYVLCRLKGIPANRLYLIAGDVNGGGHAFTAYKPTHYPYNFTVLDWCYWYSDLAIDKRHLFSIMDKEIEEWVPNFKKNNWDRIENSNYYKIWFAVNENKSMTRIRLK